MKDRATIHLDIYRHIRKMCNGRRYISHSSVMEVLKRFLPYTRRALYYPIIADLEKDSLIRKIDRTKYELIGMTADTILNKY